MNLLWGLRWEKTKIFYICFRLIRYQLKYKIKSVFGMASLRKLLEGGFFIWHDFFKEVFIYINTEYEKGDFISFFNGNIRQLWSMYQLYW
jgi:hypothetical protein